MKRNSTILILMFLFAFLGKSQAQCTIDTTQTVAGVYPSTLPSGTVGVPYSTNVTFVFLLDTSNLTIYSYHITGITGLPIGLTWACDAGNCTYNPAVTLRGCIGFSGTPVAAGTYHLIASCDVDVQLVGTSTAYEHMDLVILPNNTTNPGFSMTNSDGCAPLTVTFINNIPGDTDYLWNFGNGLQSTQEFPPNVTYTTPGTYVVTQTAVVDTLGYYLTDVYVISETCHDLADINGVSLYCEIYDGSNNLIYQTGNISDQDPPCDYPLPNIQLYNEIYTVHVWDQEPWPYTNSPDDCGTITFNGLDSGTYIINGQGGLVARITIYHPITILSATDTVHVYPTPTAPVLEAIGATSFCHGDSVTLASNITTNIQWWKDTTVLVGDTSAFIEAFDSATYYVITTNQYGCTAMSNLIPVTVYPLPIAPTFSIHGDSLVSTNSGTLQWYLNGNPIPGANSQTYIFTITGNYSLKSTNSFGCSSYSAVYYLVNSAGIQSLETSLHNFDVYPNPTNGEFTIAFELSDNQDLNVLVTDVIGKTVYSESLTRFRGKYERKLDLSSSAIGVYTVEITSGTQVAHKLLLVK